MNNEEFYKQSLQNAVELIYAYCQDNDMEKAISYFSRTSANICWDKDELYPSYQDIVRTHYERQTKPLYIQVDTPDTELVPVEDDYCLVLLTAGLLFHNKADEPMRELLRCSILFHKEDNAAKVAFIHSSASVKDSLLPNIQPLEHGITAIKELEQAGSTELALEAALNSPNALLFCRLGKDYPLVYANKAYCQLLGYDDLNDLWQHTSFAIEKIIYAADLPLLQRIMSSPTGYAPFPLIIRELTKQGNIIWLFEHCRYVIDKTSGEEFYICEALPLERYPQEFSYGRLVDYQYIDNAPVSVEQFMLDYLEYLDYDNISASCQSLLEQCCHSLSLSGIVLYELNAAGKLQPHMFFDNNGHTEELLSYSYEWEPLADYYEGNGFCTCSDWHYAPPGIISIPHPQAIRASICKTIVIREKIRYVLVGFINDYPHNWKKSEKDIMMQASKMLSLLLDASF